MEESRQREGWGKAVFDVMLGDLSSTKFKGKDPAHVASMLAYDRPSPKMLPFLSKKFGLNKFYQQSNNFVVFDEFWREYT